MEELMKYAIYTLTFACILSHTSFYAKASMLDNSYHLNNSASCQPENLIPIAPEHSLFDNTNLAPTAPLSLDNSFIYNEQNTSTESDKPSYSYYKKFNKNFQNLKNSILSLKLTKESFLNTHKVASTLLNKSFSTLEHAQTKKENYAQELNRAPNTEIANHLTNKLDKLSKKEKMHILLLLSAGATKISIDSILFINKYCPILKA